MAIFASVVTNDGRPSGATHVMRKIISDTKSYDSLRQSIAILHTVHCLKLYV